MLEWLDLSGFGPHLARFRRWLDQRPSRDFSELDAWGKLGRLVLMLAVLIVVCMPAIWLFAG